MKRFLSLKVQEDSLEINPYEITTWRPIGPRTPIAALPGYIRGKRFKGNWNSEEHSEEEDDFRIRKDNTEAEVMSLFPPIGRREIKCVLN